MAANKFITLRMGATRVVLLIGGLALKLPRFTHWHLFLEGLLANRQEYLFSRLKHKLLAPIFFYIFGGFLLVMRRAIVDKSEDTLRLWTDLALRDDDAAILLGIVESKLDSVGWIGNDVVAVDYGS